MTAVKGAAVRRGLLSAVVPPLDRVVAKARLRARMLQRAGYELTVRPYIEPYTKLLLMQPHF